MNIRFIQIFGVISFLFYILLALVLYMERVSMIDSAFQLFSIVHSEDLTIQINRYLAFFTQIFPLIGVKLNFSLEIIARIYSASFPIVYGICYVLIAFVFKDKKNAILFLIYHFLIVGHSFYWPQCELVQGISWFIVYVSFLEWQLVNSKKFYYLYLLNLGFVVSLVFMHPLILLIFSFYFLILIVEKSEYRGQYILQIALFIVISLLKKIFFENGYDNMFNYKLIHFFNDFSQARKGLKISVIYNKFILNFKFLVCAFILTIGYLIYSKRFILSAILVVYSVSLILLICIGYGMNMDLFYSEVQYNVIIFFIGCIFVFCLSINLNKNYHISFLILMFLSFNYRVVDLSHQYAARVNYLKELIKKYHGQKVIKIANQNDYKNLKLFWSSSFETWLISTIINGKSSSIIIVDDVGKYNIDIGKTNKWITIWETICYDSLNRRYFKFSDTGTYIIK